jgi:hypothetical protein
MQQRRLLGSGNSGAVWLRVQVTASSQRQSSFKATFRASQAAAWVSVGFCCANAQAEPSTASFLLYARPCLERNKHSSGIHYPPPGEINYILSRNRAFSRLGSCSSSLSKSLSLPSNAAPQMPDYR